MIFFFNLIFIFFLVSIYLGTLDAILCGQDSSKHSTSMLNECDRVLKKNGIFFIITYGQPSSRLSYFERSKYKWKVSQEILNKTRYMYILKK
jgi:ubiquinone/menaquinone biosynthesis C-methylase UbiE